MIFRGYPVVLLATLMFLLRPNFDHVSHAITRIGDVIFLGFIVVVVLIEAKVRVTRVFVMVSLPFLLAIALTFAFGVLPTLNEVFNAQDFLELCRYPLFILLPFIVGYNFFFSAGRTLEAGLRRVKAFFFLVLGFNALLMILQFLGVADNLFIKLYSQSYLNQGRSTGISLFIQECAWIVLTCSVVLGALLPTYKSYLIYLAPSLIFLTASKTAVIMYFAFVAFTVVLYDRRILKQWWFYPSCAVGCFALFHLVIFLAENFVQFRVSFYDAVLAALEGDFSDKSYTQRLVTFDRLFDDLSQSPVSAFYGTDPLFLYRTLRYEMSFFNVSAKYGLVGFFSLFVIYLAPMFQPVRRDSLAYPMKRMFIALAFALFVASFTGASMEGAKGSFLFFIAIGIWFRLERSEAACGQCLTSIAAFELEEKSIEGRVIGAKV